MLSNAFEASPRLRSLPLSTSQSLGPVSGLSTLGLAPPPMSAPISGGSVVVGSPAALPSAVLAPGSGVLIKNGVGAQSMEEEVGSS